MFNRRSFLLSSAGAMIACNFRPAPIDLAYVEEIDPISESFREQFNRDADSPRLVMRNVLPPGVAWL